MNELRAVIKYPGAKWRIAEWIIGMMPEHKSYVEPFFGSGAVFFRKPPSRIETINDLDDDVVNLFSCIRDQPDALSRAVALTPYSREEYNRAFLPAGAPARAQRSGSCGERRSSEASEAPSLHGDEGYGACDDEAGTWVPYMLPERMEKRRGGTGVRLCRSILGPPARMDRRGGGTAENGAD